MARYIDADKLLEEYGDGGNWDLRKVVKHSPTADVRENVRAEWVLDPNGIDYGIPAWKCSICGCRNNNIGVVQDEKSFGHNPLTWEGSRYCPHCGASMKGE